jgi:hypothetical protein
MGLNEQASYRLPAESRLDGARRAIIGIREQVPIDA